MPLGVSTASQGAAESPELASTTTTTASTTKPKKASSTFHLIAGLASGFTSSILLQPADLLKTRVQQSPSHSLLGSLKAIAAGPSPIRQLWRGTLPSTIRTSVGSALYFTTLNALRSRLAASEALARAAATSDGPLLKEKTGASSSTLPKLSTFANLTTGAFARASVGFVMMPITVIKVRYESSYYSYTSLLGAVRDIAGKEGLKGFFSGFGATAMRDAPYAGLYVVFYEKGKSALSQVASTLVSSDTGGHVSANTSTSGTTSDLSPSMSASVNFTSSILAASTATALTNPPDAIKTRLQVHPAKYRNSLQTLKLMLKEEGMRSLFDGLALRMARKAMSSALAWTVYEEVVRRAEVRLAAVD